MSQNPRIEDLRRRIEKDPASIAFAQLAEEYRRAGQLAEAVEACRAGLAIHPGYLSARVTLGRALLELQQLDEAKAEFEQVLKSATENLAAIRGLAEIFHRRGALEDALKQYQAALALARNDPDLEQTVNELTRQLTPKKSFEQVRSELLARPQPVMAAEPAPEASSAAAPPPVGAAPVGSSIAAPAPSVQLAVAAAPASAPAPASEPARPRAEHTIEALEKWLDAIHVSRADGKS